MCREVNWVISDPGLTYHFIAAELNNQGINKVNSPMYSSIVSGVMYEYVGLKLNQTAKRQISISEQERILNYGLVAQFYFPFSKENNKRRDEKAVSDICKNDRLVLKRIIMEYVEAENLYQKIWLGEGSKKDMDRLINLSKLHDSFPRDVENLNRSALRLLMPGF